MIQTKSVCMWYKRLALLRTLKHVLTAKENDLRRYLKDVGKMKSKKDNEYTVKYEWLLTTETEQCL